MADESGLTAPAAPGVPPAQTPVEDPYTALIKRVVALSAQEREAAVQAEKVKALRGKIQSSEGWGGAFANLVNQFALPGAEAAARKGAEAALDTKSKILGDLPGMEPAPAALPQERAAGLRRLSRALAGSPSFQSQIAEYDKAAAPLEAEAKWQAGNDTGLTKELMKTLSAETIAEIKARRATVSALSNDAVNSAAVTHYNPDGSVHHIEMIGKAKPPSLGGAGGAASEEPLTDEAARQWAIAAAKDKSVISAFNPRGNNRVKIANWVTKLYPNTALASEWAAYKAGSAANTENEKSLTAIRPYHEQLKKNADILSSYLDRIPDSGAMPVNAIIRGWSRHFGDEDVAGFEAALNAYSMEAARIISTPRLIGQLTDTAQEHIRAVHSGSYSAKQLRTVIKVTLAEAENRLEGLVGEGLVRKGQFQAHPETPKDQSVPAKLGGETKEQLKARLRRELLGK